MSAILPEIFSVLKIAVLEPLQGYRFKSVTQLPDWFPTLYQDSENNIIDLEGLSPFLENFIIDAQHFWTGRASSPLSSGIWSETDFQGHEHYLEATALLIQQKAVLVITDLSDSFAERHQVFQRAREIALENEKLLLALNQQQRKLQTSIEHQLLDASSPQELTHSIKYSSSAILIYNSDGSVNVANNSLYNIYNYEMGSEQLSQSMLDIWINEAKSTYPEIEFAISNGAYWEGEFETTDLNGEKKWLRLTLGPVKGQQDNVTHYVCIANDISDIHTSAVELDSTHELDLTTQLPNRHSFWKQITQQVSSSQDTGSVFALLYIDLDHFKRINESLGHHAGDYLLSTFASRLANNTKHCDCLCHLGGDEFAVIAQVESLEKAEKIAQRLLSAMGPAIFIDDKEVVVSASIGIAMYPFDGADATTLVKHADMAMFNAKELGRNQHQHFDKRMQTQFLNRLTIEKDIDNALKRGEFELHYQPQVCLGKDPFLRLEALIRWRHPKHGLLSPIHFIPIAEKSGQIVPIGDWVTREACHQAMVFAEQQVNVIVAINVSAWQVRRRDFIPKIADALAESGLPPQHLELEITETSFLEDMDTVITTLTALRAKGITISIDDFGSGFSSLAYLRSLPVDHIKLDQGFVRGLPSHEESKAITVSVIRLAHELNMKVVAEGVETNGQLRFLRGQQCDYVQGYLFFKPMEPTAIPQLYDTILTAGTNAHPL